MATWRVTYRGHSVDVEAQYASGAFSAARPLLVQKSGSTEIAFVDCDFRELPAEKAEAGLKGARVA